MTTFNGNVLYIDHTKVIRRDAMSRMEKLLSQYAAYHLDKKNIMTHFIGIPLIVFSIMCLTAKIGFSIAGFSITLTAFLIVLIVLYYLSLDIFFGILIGILFILVYPSSVIIADMSTVHWLFFSIATFIVGWVFQFVGHFYERKKPAFMDDMIGLAIGPLFVIAEFVFIFGFRKKLKTTILEEAKRLRHEMDEQALSINVAKDN